MKTPDDPDTPTDHNADFMARDALARVVADLFGVPDGSRARTQLRQGLDELERRDATPREIVTRHREWQRLHPGEVCRFSYLVDDWPTLDGTLDPPPAPTPTPARARDRNCSSCGGSGWLHPVEDFEKESGTPGTAYRCPECNPR